MQAPTLTSAPALASSRMARLSKQSYYAPLPMFTLNSELRIEDFNLAFDLLASDATPVFRYQDLQSAFQALGVRPDASATTLESSCAGSNSHIEEIPPTGPLEVETYRLHCKNFGAVRLRALSIGDIDPESGEQAGTTTSWEILEIGDESTYRQRLTEACIHQLIWESYAISYDRVLPRLPFYREVVESHVQTLATARVSDILDLGAGTGNVTARLLANGCRVTAVDVSRAMLDKLLHKLSPSNREAITVLEQSAEQLPQLAAESVDAVNVLLALYDMRYPARALEEAIRVLRPGGTLVITEPKRTFNLQNLLTFSEQYLRDQGLYEALEPDWRRINQANKALDPCVRGRRLFAEDLLDRLDEAGFEKVKVQDSHIGNCATISAAK